MKWSNSKVYALAARFLTLMIMIWALTTVYLSQAQELIAPAEVPGETYFAAFPVTINVDGDLQEWSNVPYATVTQGPHPSADPSQNGSVSFAAVADTQNLYFSFVVTDSHIVTGQHGIQYWFEDSVEVYINATGDLTLTSYGPGVAQINIPAVNIGVPIDDVILGGIGADGLGARAAVVAADNGYAIEASVPLASSAWDITPTNGGILGFQVQLNGASERDRDIKLSWSNRDRTDDQSFQNPSYFGQLQFVQVGEGEAPASPSPAPTAAEAASRPPSGGSFTVNGSTIVDPNGSVFVAKGVNVSGSNWVWSRPTVPDVGSIVDCWRFNLVRVNSFLFTGEQPWPQNDVNNDLDTIVRTFTERGVVVVLEAHDRIGGYYRGDDLSRLVQWFTDLASRYRDNPYVWFDVMNEPGGLYSIDSEQWVNMHGQVIQAIRAAGANNIIIVEGANGGQDAGDTGSGVVNENSSAILQYADDLLNFNGQSFDNIVFSIHPYDQWNGGDARMADFFDRVLTRDLALIIGEYGVQTNANTQSAAQSLFSTAPSRSIGRIVWHWDGSDANDLTTNTSTGGGWEIDNCEAPTNLSWLGSQVWDDNH
jgi:hypothetical protein